MNVYRLINSWKGGNLWEWGEMTVDILGNEDKEAVLNGLMNTYGQDILRLVYSYVNDKAMAEDLTQEIFVKCYKSLHTYKGNANIKTWLWRIAINHCKDYLKSWHNKYVIVSENESTNTNTNKEMIEQLVIQKEDDHQLVIAIMNLPIKYREVLYLFYYENLSLKELSVLIGKNENTVKTRLRRAKELLKERLEE
ncbi:MAG: sigma-70 family RNA polymerase sigma factor [Firmicutes bacterium]|nr:sigma-70 family RNA polymerase sigma factor [Bacillota bacterium]